MPTPQQGPTTPPTAPATPTAPAAPKLPSVGSVLGKLGQAADTALDVAGKAKLPEAAKAVVKVGTTLANANATVLKIDSAMKDLEKAAPGTTKLVSETATAFAEAGKLLGDPKNLPAKMQPLAADAKKTLDAFAKFATDYKSYSEAGLLDKPAAGIKAAAAWTDFKKTFDGFQKEFGKSGLSAGAAAVQGVLDRLK